MTTSSSNNVAPGRKTRRVDLNPAAAFEPFTQHLHEWWPTTAHSVGGLDAAKMRPMRAALG